MMAERGVVVSHTTIHRWVIRYVPEFEKRWNRFARPVNNSRRVDETYVKIRGKWNCLYRAIDKHASTDKAGIWRCPQNYRNKGIKEESAQEMAGGS
jgi:transposase-like protein